METGTAAVKAKEGDEDSGIESIHSGGQPVISIYIPKVDVKKYLQYNQEDSVWAVKQAVLSGLDVQLIESFNYGLYYPPANGRAGKFLDEERCMSEYPLPGSVGRLETVRQLQLKYKSRVYKHLQDRPKDLVQINNRESQRKFMAAVKKNDIDKMTKMTDRGLDPNFIDLESGGETPLTLTAITLSNPQPMMQALVGGGAHLDFRNSQSLTAIHRAALNCNRESIKALLALGSSANYQDSRCLTPLYYCISNADNAQSAACMEVLLYDHASVDAVDNKGCTPLHQVCKAGKVKLLDMLIYYGADVNAQNNNGNTPLHLCAAEDQLECARVLLFRGADKHVLNRTMFDAHRVASISQHKRIAELIESFQDRDVVRLSQQPIYNDKRRSRMVGGTIPRVHSYTLDSATSPKRQPGNHAPVSLSNFIPPETANNTNTGANQTRPLSSEQRATIADILRQHSQQPQDRASTETASIRSHVTAKKAAVQLPDQQRQRPSSADMLSGPVYQQQKPEFYTNSSGYRGSFGEEKGQPTDVYENIDVCMKTVAVLKEFDAVVNEPEGRTQDDATDMLSQAERARQRLINNRSREVDHTNLPHAGNGLRPIPQQRSSISSDPQSEEFKQLLAAKAANRRVPEDFINNQNNRLSGQPVPVTRPGYSRAVSVDAAGDAWKKPPPVKQKTRTLTSDEATSQQGYSDASRQRRSLEINRQTLPPSPPAGSMITDDFDMPPPPEEYCNLPAITTMPPSTLSHGLPPPATNSHPPADWQREIAGKFRHQSAPTNSLPLSIADNHDLPPPPSGFHDDIPADPGVSAAPPPSFKIPAAGGYAGKTGGLAGTVSGPMSSWSRDDVVRWLVTLNMPEHCDAFAAASISGQRLIQLTDDDLYALGVTQFGQRKMILRAIEND